MKSFVTGVAPEVEVGGWRYFLLYKRKEIKFQFFCPSFRLEKLVPPVK